MEELGILQMECYGINEFLEKGKCVSSCNLSRPICRVACHTIIPHMVYAWLQMFDRL